MINLLLVDDETKIRNGLLNHIDWRKLGISTIQTASNGQEALELCHTFQPDILLTDIRMREMNGIHLCQELLILYPKCKIIFISGYSDKDYLKAAIRFGAVDYIEKPINPRHLEDILKKTITTIKNERLSFSLQHRKYLCQIKENVLLNFLQPSSDPFSTEDFKNFFPEIYSYMRVGILHTSKAILNYAHFLTHLKFLNASLSSNTHIIYNCLKDNRNIILLISSEYDEIINESPFIQRISQDISSFHFDNTFLFLSLGSIIQDYLDLPSSYADALSTYQTIAYEGYKNTVFFKPSKDRTFSLFDSELFSNFFEALKNSDFQKTYLILDILKEFLMCERPLSLGYVRNLYYTFYQYIIFCFQSQNIDNNLCKKDFSDFDTIEDMNQFLYEHIDSLAHCQKQTLQIDSSLNAILYFIHDNYMNHSLSIQKIADYAGFSQTYLSTLFRQKQGVTISDYITKLRVNQAQILIRNSKKPLYEIAHDVGYDDANYFTKIFKKNTGLTPREYRERSAK